MFPALLKGNTLLKIQLLYEQDIGSDIVNAIRIALREAFNAQTIYEETLEYQTHSMIIEEGNI